MVVQSHVTHERLLQILTAGKSVRFKHISNASIKAFDHAIGSGRGGLVRRCAILRAWHSWSNSWLPVAWRSRLANNLSVNSLPLSDRIFCILIEQTLCKAFRNERAAAAVLWLLI